MKLHCLAAALLLCITPLQFFSCTGNKSTEVRTVTLHDTLFKDTFTLRDTLFDTAKISVGKPGIVAVGLLVGAIKSGAVTRTDSFYASMCINANPEIPNAVVAYGIHRLDYINNQKISGFLNGILNDFSILPNVAAANYEASFKDSSQKYVCRIVAPYYADASQQTVLFDTLTDSTSLPPAADTVRFASDSGTRYDSVDYFGKYIAYRIRLDQGLKVTWHGGARWYAVECRKYLDMSGNYKTIGVPIDTFTSDSSFAVAKDYLHQDTAYNDTFSYDFLYIQVIPITGPPPALWASLASFSGSGYLFCMRQANPYFFLNAYPKSAPRGGLGKRMSRSAPFTPPSSAEVLARVLSQNLAIRRP
jgi:hypothetical protein